MKRTIESLLQALRASWLAYEPHVTSATLSLGLKGRPLEKPAVETLAAMA